MIKTMRVLLQDSTLQDGMEVTVRGWIRTNRAQKEFGFIQLNDGSTVASLQVVYDTSLKDFADISKYRCGCAIIATGKLVLTPNAKQPFEMKAEEVLLVGDCPTDYPIQPKRHSPEFLREQAYLRMRTNTYNAVFRIRSILAYAIHRFFQENNFVYAHTPLITASDAEGAGDMFQVTTLDLNNVPRTEEGDVDYSKDFFGKKANLTVSGQLEAETFALAFGNVYTFGPTFRAEVSNTKRHASEFWMIEPEMAFADLKDDMNVIERMLKYVVKYTLDNAKEEMNFFEQFVCPGKIKQLQALLDSHIAECEYKHVVELVQEAAKKGHPFEHVMEYGDDLGTEHEKFLTDEVYNSPVFVTNWPKEIKAFYMRLNDDGKTVAAVDLLVPGSGELVGGSQREERYDLLKKVIEERGVKNNDWYLNLRKYGSCKHAGFGLGFERLIMYVTGMDNIRDVLAYPRTPNNCEY